MHKLIGSFLLQILILLAITSSAFATEVRVSKYYDIGKTTGSPTFTQETLIERSAPDSFVSNAKITDPAGKTVMTEKAIVVEGKITFQYVEQLQSGEAWQLEVKDGKAIFKTYKLEDGKRFEVGSGKSESVKGDFINGPLTELFIARNWDALVKGSELKVRFSILELEESIGFKFFKVGQGKRNGQDMLGVKMKPSNFIVSMLADPIHIEFAAEQKRMAYYRGRTPLKAKEGGKWKPYDAEIIYELSSLK